MGRTHVPAMLVTVTFALVAVLLGDKVHGDAMEESPLLPLRFSLEDIDPKDVSGVDKVRSGRYHGETASSRAPISDGRRPKHHSRPSSSGSSLGLEAFLSKIAVLIFFLLILLGFFIHVYCCHKNSPEGSYRERRNEPRTPRSRQHGRESGSGGVFTITMRPPIGFNEDKPPSYEEATGIREYDSPPPKYSGLFNIPDAPISSLPISYEDAISNSDHEWQIASTSTSTISILPQTETQINTEELTHRDATDGGESVRHPTPSSPNVIVTRTTSENEGAYSNAAFVSDVENVNQTESDHCTVVTVPEHSTTENAGEISQNSTENEIVMDSNHLEVRIT